MEKKERRVGTVSRGIRCPIIRQGDDLAQIVADSVLEAAEAEGFELRDRDVISITESIVARAQGNYASVDNIAADVKAKTGGETVGVIFPILSRNRFAICLKGIAKGVKKVVLMLSYPSDEVGNELVSLDKIDEAGVNPYSDVLSLEKYRELFGKNLHEFTGVDYVEYYGDVVRSCGAEVEFVFANQAKTILDYTDCESTVTSTPVPAPRESSKQQVQRLFSVLMKFSTLPLTAADITKTTGFSAQTCQQKIWLSFSQEMHSLSCLIFRKKSSKQQASTLKLWFTATVQSKTPRAKSGSLQTPLFHPHSQTAL